MLLCSAINIRLSEIEIEVSYIVNSRLAKFNYRNLVGNFLGQKILIFTSTDFRKKIGDGLRNILSCVFLKK